MRGSSLPLKRWTARRMSAWGPRRGRGWLGAATVTGWRFGWRFGSGASAGASLRRAVLGRRLRRGALRPCRRLGPLPRGGRLRLLGLSGGRFHRCGAPPKPPRARARPRRGSLEALSQSIAGPRPAWGRLPGGTGLVGGDPAGRLGARAAQDADAQALVVRVDVLVGLLALEDRPPADGAGREGVGLLRHAPQRSNAHPGRRAAACRASQALTCSSSLARASAITFWAMCAGTSS